MKIGQLADAASVTTKTIRYYESIGLMAEPSRSPSGYRDYDDAAIDRLRFVRGAQASGLTLAEIQSVLELKDSGSRSCDHTRSLLKRHLAEIDAQIDHLRRSRDELTILYEEAGRLDPADCTDPNRCQVISAEQFS